MELVKSRSSGTTTHLISPAGVASSRCVCETMDACLMLPTFDNSPMLQHKHPARVGNAEEFDGLCFIRDCGVHGCKRQNGPWSGIQLVCQHYRMRHLVREHETSLLCRLGKHEATESQPVGSSGFRPGKDSNGFSSVVRASQLARYEYAWRPIEAAHAATNASLHMMRRDRPPSHL